MGTLTWKFLSNTFEVQTRGSNVKMLSIVTDTDAKLQNENADPDILNLYTILHPVYDNYRQVSINYDMVVGNYGGGTLALSINYDMVVGNYGGGTLAFENLMDTLPLELRKWEGAVRAVYYEDSPEERAIFPNKRSPFLQGTYEDRLSAIGTLSQKLSTIAALSTTHTLVSNFYTLALSTRLAQQQGEGALGQVSDLREQQRILVAEALYGVLGGLMLKFRSDPTQVERFFDLELLRSKGAGQTTGPATLNGRVLDVNTLNPIFNARVVLRNADGQLEVFTDANGVFTITTGELTEAVEAELEVSAAGYAIKVMPIVVEPATSEDVEVLLAPLP